MGVSHLSTWSCALNSKATLKRQENFSWVVWCLLGTLVSGEKRTDMLQTPAVLHIEALQAVSTTRGKTLSLWCPVSQGGCDGIRGLVSARVWDGL